MPPRWSVCCVCEWSLYVCVCVCACVRRICVGAFMGMLRLCARVCVCVCVCVYEEGGVAGVCVVIMLCFVCAEAAFMIWLRLRTHRPHRLHLCSADRNAAALRCNQRYGVVLVAGAGAGAGAVL
jgi:hypothetical protein